MSHSLDGPARGRQASLLLRQERARRRAVELSPVINELRRGGAISYQSIADGLNAREVKVPRGTMWKRSQVRHLIGQIVTYGPV